LLAGKQEKESLALQGTPSLNRPLAGEAPNADKKAAKVLSQLIPTLPPRARLSDIVTGSR
jgi:hypothetical protein